MGLAAIVLSSMIGGSILIWFFNFTVLKGLKQASFVNAVATVCKILPLVVFIIAMIAVFNFDKFSFDFWGHSTLNGETNLGSLPSQIKSTMLVTLWAFIGIEGAVVLSGRAKSPNDVGKATILGFAGGLLVFVLLSVLPFGVMTQAELVAVKNPSTAGVLEHVVGTWGAWLMNIGLIIAILANWLAWTMITAEVPYAAAKDGAFPKIFEKFERIAASIIAAIAVIAVILLATGELKLGSAASAKSEQKAAKKETAPLTKRHG
ncbi:amino acid permease [Intestinicryptomonas porci]|uniref:Amino acid permease n=1 Tax=Intestinicryptomonas porci TaxID=2926320 RepID=A0ABU4WHW8_9BACT|nr:amino acid permease [Opitutales bacterium CLA-KB-P66]